MLRERYLELLSDSTLERRDRDCGGLRRAVEERGAASVSLLLRYPRGSV